MKKKLTITAALISCMAGLSGCDGGGWNHALCRQAVVDEVKTTDVQLVPGQDWRWIARASNGDVWYVETMGSKPDVTAKTLIFKGGDQAR